VKEGVRRPGDDEARDRVEVGEDRRPDDDRDRTPVERGP